MPSSGGVVKESTPPSGLQAPTSSRARIALKTVVFQGRVGSVSPWRDPDTSGAGSPGTGVAASNHASS